MNMYDTQKGEKNYCRYSGIVYWYHMTYCTMRGRKDTATFWLSLKVFETTASDGQKLKHRRNGKYKLNTHTHTHTHTHTQTQTQTNKQTNKTMWVHFFRRNHS